MVDAAPDKEYAGITGVPAFVKAAVDLAYSPDAVPVQEGCVAATQTISGTGALRVGGEFLARFYPGAKTIYLPTPSWANHAAVFKDSGLTVEKYRYYNKDTIGLDFEGMVEDIKKAPKGSIILLHACAHNPTGIDPTEQQWRQLSEVVKEAGHYPFFDMAYQGFASGNINKDAFPVRHFVAQGHQLCLAQSFAKNMVLTITHLPLYLLVCAVSTDLLCAGPVRRARGLLLDRVRVGRGEEAGGLADQDPGAAAVLQPAHPRRAHRRRDPQQRRQLLPVAGRGQGHGRPHHPHARPAQGQPRGAGQQAQLGPHHVAGTSLRPLDALRRGVGGC